MTIEQSKELIPDKSSVIYKNEICQLWRFLHTPHDIELLTPSKRLVSVNIKDCQTLGEFRGSFDSSVFPPKPEFEETSIDVIAYNPGWGMEIVFYNYNKEQWFNIEGEPIMDKFKYIFKPDYL